MGNFSSVPKSSVPTNLASTAVDRRIAELEEKIKKLEACITVSPGGELKLQANSIKIVAADKCQVNAAHLEIESPSMNIGAQVVRLSTGALTVTAPISTFSGIVKCEVIQATTVMGTTYTPGAGNLW